MLKPIAAWCRNFSAIEKITPSVTAFGKVPLMLLNVRYVIQILN